MSAAAASTARPTPRESFADKRVTVVGLGRFGGGVGVTRWLVAQGARVTVSDKAPAEQLSGSIAALDGLDVTLHLGGHDERDFLDADLLVASPAVPPDMPLLAAARKAGVPVTSEMNLFMERCAAPVVAVTGTVGKSTTTAMIGELLATLHTTHVGGNIGRSLLAELEAIAPDHVVVLELSSFQLEDAAAVRFRPRVALVTNLAPNHLDRHGTLEAYADAKKNIFRFQRPDDVLVLNAACPLTAAWAEEAPSRAAWFDPAATDPFELAVPGAHNQANAQAAWTVAKELGARRDAAAAVLREFAGLPHRLQRVAEIDGVRYFNDSKCTTPEGAIVALEAFEPARCVVIVGGYDKHVSFEHMGRALASRAKAVVALGATREQIVAAFAAAGGGPEVVRAETFPEAVSAARSRAGAGDVVLLSPACASYDMFANYEQRGEEFIRLVTGGRDR